MKIISLCCFVIILSSCIDKINEFKSKKDGIGKEETLSQKESNTETKTESKFNTLLEDVSFTDSIQSLDSSEKNSQNELYDSIVYYDKRTILIWHPSEQEAKEYMSEFPEEDDWNEVISDELHYLGEAYEYLEKKGETSIHNTTESIGFIYKQDTTILNRKNQDHFYRIVLFDWETKPIVVAPIDISNDEFLWFFNKKEF